MDHQRAYYSLMESRRNLPRKKVNDGSLEEHHIWPSSLGGTKSNLVLLTPLGNSQELLWRQPPSLWRGDITLLRLGKKISDGHKGRSKSDDHRRNLSIALKGRGPSPEAIEKSAAQNRGRSQDRVSYPNCGKSGGRVAMYRWHFENCRRIDL